jgi:hypothetical protein
MTEPEVEALLGGPPRITCGDWGDLINYYHITFPIPAEELFTREGIKHPDGQISRSWFSSQALISLLFDADGRVCRKSVYKVPSKLPNIFEIVRDFWNHL